LVCVGGVVMKSRECRHLGPPVGPEGELIVVRPLPVLPRPVAPDLLGRRPGPEGEVRARGPETPRPARRRRRRCTDRGSREERVRSALMLSDLVYRLSIAPEKADRAVYGVMAPQPCRRRYQITRNLQGSSQSMVRVSQISTEPRVSRFAGCVGIAPSTSVTRSPGAMARSAMLWTLCWREAPSRSSSIG
jgi:hypothetical protein